MLLPTEPPANGPVLDHAPGHVGQATTYYVSPSGNDNNSGTSPGNAWRTTSEVNRRKFGPGDRILFEGGQTFPGTLYFDAQDAGTATAPVTVSSYGTGRAILNAGNARAIFVRNAGGFRLSNLMIVGAGRTVNGAEGIFFYIDLPGNAKLNYLRLDSLEVSGFGSHGVLLGSGSGKSGFQDVRITNVSSHDNAMSGVTIYGLFSSIATGYAHANVYVGHVTAYNNSGKGGLSFNSGNGINLSDISGGTIERSVAYNNGFLNTANGGPVGIWVWDCNNCTIQYNESHHNRTASSSDGGGFDLDGGTTNSVMQYNYSHDNDGAGFLLAQFSGARPYSGVTVRYNISQNDGRKNGYAGLQIGSGINNAEVYNNAIYVNAPAAGAPRALWLTSGTTNVHVRNNILVTANAMRLVEGSSAGSTGLLFQGNNYWSSGASFLIRWNNVDYGSFSAWQSASGLERIGATLTGYSLNPLLVSPGGGGTLNNADLLSTVGAYRLQSSSPMIDAGLDLLALFGINPGSRDFYGSVMPQGVRADIGAHEATPAPSNQAPTASITSPAAGATFLQGASVSFAGSGTDPESGALTGAALVWTSSRDGQIGTGTSFSKSNLTVGTHTITLTATDPQGAFGTASRTITINAAPGNQPPVANFTFDCSAPGLLPHQCTLDATSSTDDVGIVPPYGWDFGNGKTANTTNPQIAMRWAAAGAYNVSLTVRDAGGLTHTITKVMQVP